jgi:hypothetical protein
MRPGCRSADKDFTVMKQEQTGEGQGASGDSGNTPKT